MSKRTRTLILGVTLAALNLTGAVAQAKPPTSPPATWTPAGHPARGRSERPGTNLSSQPSSPPSPATPGGPRPRAKWARPGATRPAPRCDRPNQAARPAGSSHPSVG